MQGTSGLLPPPSSIFGDVEDEQGNHGLAVELYEEGIALCRKSGYTVLLADILVNLGYTTSASG